MDAGDDTLWERCRAGDAEALGALFERHAKAIYNYCFRRVGDWALAEDLVSVVFLEAWRRHDASIEPGKVVPWLYGIATNVIRNRRRWERRHAAALRRLPQPQPESSFADDAEARLDDVQAARRALALLDGLPRRERDVFALCAWFELPYEDAAFALGVPVGTVRSRLARARRRLERLAAPQRDHTTACLGEVEVP